MQYTSLFNHSDNLGEIGYGHSLGFIERHTGYCVVFGCLGIYNKCNKVESV